MRSGGRSRTREEGFSLLELLVATAIFLVICATMFGLLNLSQRNYSNESQMSGSFQEARLAMDQIVRDFNQSGFPGLGMFSVTPNAANYAVGPVAWSPSYPTLPCTLGGGCNSTPGDFDLIIETQLDNSSTGTVQWIRYQLQNGTLYRSVVPKTAGADPVAATSAPGVQVPFLTNVMNSPSSAQIAEVTATYPTMFPGALPVPIFQFSCDTGAGTVPCPTAVGANSPLNIRDVDITLIVATPVRDAQTQKLKLIELNGRGHRLNPTN
ncbi:MAG TPA: prepilin-type N-terminal cleavage/methylation domain-containing protein [Candidatus Acidoferrum sp.]